MHFIVPPELLVWAKTRYPNGGVQCVSAQNWTMLRPSLLPGGLRVWAGKSAQTAPNVHGFHATQAPRFLPAGGANSALPLRHQLCVIGVHRHELLARRCAQNLDDLHLRVRGASQASHEAAAAPCHTTKRRGAMSGLPGQLVDTALAWEHGVPQDELGRNAGGRPNVDHLSQDTMGTM